LVDDQAQDPWGHLMRAAMQGDASAYRTLFEQLSHALRKQVSGNLNRSGQGNIDIDDIVQEALLAVHLKRHTWDPLRPFLPWVNAVTRYKIIDAFRRRRTYIEINELEKVLADQAPIERDREDALRLIAELSPRDQTIVMAVSLEERPPNIVASELGMSEGALRVALHRALKKLAALYRKGNR